MKDDSAYNKAVEWKVDGSMKEKSAAGLATAQ